MDSLRSVSFRVAALVAALCVILLGAELASELRQRRAEVARVETATGNLARSLAQQAEDALQMADIVLAGMVERLEIDGTGTEALSRLRRLLVTTTGRLPRLQGLFVYAEDGRWLATSAPDAPVHLNNSDRDYFKHHRAVPDRGPYLGPPVRSRSQGNWIVTVSRRFDRPDGSFAGVVLATMNVESFSRFYETLDIGEEGSIAILNERGMLLSRNPFDDRFIGRDLSGEPFYADLAAGAADGVLRFRSPLDGIKRITSYKRGTRFPIVVLAAMGEDEALADWSAGASIRVGIVASLALAAALAGALLIRRLNRVRQFQEALAENEANFRMIAESADDLVSRIGADAIRRYVSPAAKRLLGREPAEMVGRSALDDLSTEDRKAFEVAAEQLRRRDVDAVTVTHRTKHANGSKRWLETTLRLSFDVETGKPDGVVAVSRDVTERKIYEAELSALASKDGLTGLANRRVFDESLSAELRRARRDGKPISLVLFDIDRFKQFNDTYGHVAGDAALAAVAGVLERGVHRPGDLAARYGGEELALILPSTDAAGARLVADRVRAEVCALAIRHELNLPSEMVTVSAGVAAFNPGEHRGGTAAAARLVEEADRALYAAKREGRNTVRVASSPATDAAPTSEAA